MIDTYVLPEIGDLWKEEKKYQHWLEIELSACEARTAIEDLPESTLNDLYRYAKFDLDQCKRLQEELHDEYQAFLRNIADGLGDDYQYFHRDITDAEVQDIAFSMTLRDSLNVLLEKLSQARAAVGDKARKYKKSYCMGRVNGIHTAPTTFGLKMAEWYTILTRDSERLKKTRDEVAYGKVSGPVGTMGSMDPRIEAYVCMNAGLQVCPAAGAMVPRDGHAVYMTTLAVVAGTLEKFALELRTLQSSEFLEIEEPYFTGRNMPLRIPYRREPKLSDTMLALGRIIRSHVTAALENIAQQHEGDTFIRQSEQMIYEESTVLLYYMLELLLEIMQGLCVREDRMLENLEKLGGLIFAEKVAEVLQAKGVGRDKAKMIAQNYAENSMQDHVPFKDALSENVIVKDKLTEEEFQAMFRYDQYIQNIDEIFKRCGL